ncbi:MAG: FtsX-like permease family protein, partial [Acidimicrobiia bacterium]|nr:FtsX-like permease family protein [Acidimicrobiia bacterium]
TTRMVEATRREFGIAMALGAPRPRIATRPLLVGAQISLLGAAFGVGLGLIINSAMGAVLEEFLPLPVWETPFQVREFALAAGIGFFAPFLAAAVPVVRALRVQPVDAIRTGHLAARSQGFASLLRRLPGDTFAKMPFRNLLRAPRRTLLTALGVGAAVTVLVGMVVMVDSFVATIDAGAAEMTEGSPDRILVGIDTFRAIDSSEIAAVADAESVASVESSLKVPATVFGPDSTLDVQIEVVDLQSDLWHPTIVAGSAATDGIVLAEKGAADLGVRVGDTVTVRHPRREGVASFGLVDSEMTVAAIHPHPFRFVTYVDDGQAEVFGMVGLTNSLSLEAAAGYGIGDVQRELFDNGAVTSVLSADSVADIIRDFLEQFLGILQIAEAGAVALMFLIAFNSASVAFDERARDHATMMAFGVPRRRILRSAIIESGVIGILATFLGALGGFAFLRWAVRTNIEQTVPDIALEYVVTPSLLGGVVALGVVVVALAPLLTYRKLRRLDIPSTLRVME